MAQPDREVQEHVDNGIEAQHADTSEGNDFVAVRGSSGALIGTWTTGRRLSFASFSGDTSLASRVCYAEVDSRCTDGVAEGRLATRKGITGSFESDLIDHVVDHVSKRGARRLELEVELPGEAGRQEAVASWSSRGFEVDATGERLRVSRDLVLSSESGRERGDNEERSPHAADEWRSLVAAEVAGRFPGLGSAEQVASRIEMLASGDYERRVDEVARERGWHAEDAAGLKAPEVNGFCDGSRAFVRWNGHPGEVSTLYHEAYHLAHSEMEDSGIPACILEGFVETEASRSAGPWDRILGSRAFTDEKGTVYDALYVADPAQFARMSQGRERLHVSGGTHRYEAVRVGGEALISDQHERLAVLVGPSYPAAMTAVGRIEMMVSRDVIDEAVTSGDDRALRRAVDETWGRGRYEAVVRALGPDPQGWYEPARVEAVEKLLPPLSKLRY